MSESRRSERKGHEAGERKKAAGTLSSPSFALPSLDSM